MTTRTVSEAIRQGAAIAGWRDTLTLLALATGYTHTDLLVHGEWPVTSAAEAAFGEMLDKRKAHMPVQYITGRWPFMGLELTVDPRALIPRPETEILVEAVLKHIKNGKIKKPPRVLDLCTGSGCIGIALAHHCGTAVTAVDISPDALALAAENARACHVEGKIRFVTSDLYSGLTNESAFDIIVSNPPYIPTGDIAALDDDVKNYEPLKALDGGGDGLDLYRRLIPESVAFLCPGGALFLEIGPRTGVTALMKQAGYKNITVLRDFAKLDRVVYGTHK